MPYYLTVLLKKSTYYSDKVRQNITQFGRLVEDCEILSKNCQKCLNLHK